MRLRGDYGALHRGQGFRGRGMARIWGCFPFKPGMRSVWARALLFFEPVFDADRQFREEFGVFLLGDQPLGGLHTGVFFLVEVVEALDDAVVAPSFEPYLGGVDDVLEETTYYIEPF